VLLHPDNVEAWALFNLPANEIVGRLLPTLAGRLLVEELLAGMTREEATGVVKRAVHALQDGRVLKAQYPEPKDPAGAS
jgi:hypothetical protein